MKKDVVKELSSIMKTRKKNLDENEILAEAQKLLEYNAAEDLDMMRALGPQSKLAQSEKERGRIIEIENTEKFTGGEVFTRRQIIELAIKYRLKFLPSKHYRGHIDSAVIPAIREMERNMSKNMTEERAKREGLTVEEYIRRNGEVKHKLDAYQLKENFYILAPPKLFVTKKEKITTFKMVEPDPIMFYTNDNEHFTLIKKWGSDFTIFRLILGFMGKNTANHRWTYVILFTLFIVLPLVILFNWAFVALALAIVPIRFAGDDNSYMFGEDHVTNTISTYF